MQVNFEQQHEQTRGRLCYSIFSRTGDDLMSEVIPRGKYLGLPGFEPRTPA